MSAEVSAAGSGYKTMADQIRLVQQSLGEIEAAAESNEGLIVATVGARGELRSLTLDPRIYRNPDATALAEEIMDVVRSAAETAGRQAFDVAGALLPPTAELGKTDLAFDPVLHELDRRTAGRE